MPYRSVTRTTKEAIDDFMEAVTTFEQHLTFGGIFDDLSSLKLKGNAITPQQFKKFCEKHELNDHYKAIALRMLIVSERFTLEKRTKKVAKKTTPRKR
jgi:hypothetical protein